MWESGVFATNRTAPTSSRTASVFQTRSCFSSSISRTLPDHPNAHATNPSIAATKAAVITNSGINPRFPPVSFRPFSTSSAAPIRASIARPAEPKPTNPSIASDSSLTRVCAALVASSASRTVAALLIPGGDTVATRTPIAGRDCFTRPRCLAAFSNAAKVTADE